MLEDEAYSPACMVVWAMATKTQGFIFDKIGTADTDSLGTQSLLKAVAASARLWQIRFKLRVKEIRRRRTHTRRRSRTHPAPVPDPHPALVPDSHPAPVPDPHPAPVPTE